MLLIVTDIVWCCGDGLILEHDSWCCFICCSSINASEHKMYKNTVVISIKTHKIAPCEDNYDNFPHFSECPWSTVEAAAVLLVSPLLSQEQNNPLQNLREQLLQLQFPSCGHAQSSQLVETKIFISYIEAVGNIHTKLHQNQFRQLGGVCTDR